MTSAAPSTTPATPTSPGTRRRLRGPVLLLVIGAMAALGGPIVGVLTGSLALVPGVWRQISDVTEIQPTGTRHLEAEEKIYLLAPVAQLADVTHEDCTATSDRGPAEVVFAPATALNTLVDGTRYESFASITAPTAGEYTITCRADDVSVVAAPEFNFRTVFGPFLWLTVAGLVVAVAGVVMIIVGIVRLARR